MKKLLLIFLLFAFVKVYATHMRAGEITYRVINCKTYTYEITATIYTKHYTQLCCPYVSSGASDQQCSIDVYVGEIISGDSVIITVPRSNGPIGTCSPAHMGEQIPGTNVRKNIYTFQYSFTNPGPKWISTMLTNRDEAVLNVPNSVNQPMFLKSLISVGGKDGCNNSAVLLKPPVDFACVGQCFIHNPAASDIDGDSLAYQISESYGIGGQIISGYVFPDQYNPPNGTMQVNPLTGDLTWCPGPTQAGEYNVAMWIKEYRKISGGNTYALIGEILRDIQIDVEQNCNNQPPVIADVQDTCIIAGTNLTFTVTAVDPDANNILLSVTGSPFGLTPAATFTTPSQPQSSPATGVFSWTPDCNKVRNQPYPVYFYAVDTNLAFNAIPLADFETVLIKVVAPAPTNLTANPQCNNMRLCWTVESCNPAANPCKGYKIYRRTGCSTWTPSSCETGVPSYTGYVLVGETYNKDSVCFTDSNNGNGLTPGVDYAYRVSAKFLDGALSLSSTAVCASVKRDVPIITNVDVASTSATIGIINIKWVSPIGGNSSTGTALDTVANPGPYQYLLYRSTGFVSATTLIQTFTATYFGGATGITSFTSFTDSNLNTQDNPYTYRIEFYVNGIPLCKTQNASSVYLSCIPTDNALNLSWQANVPWGNTGYEVWKETTPTSGIWNLLATVSSPSYLDTGLVNGATYCYKIKTLGSYSDTTLPTPLINWSEEHCCVPVDLIPPCPPSLNLSFDCGLGDVTLTWTNPNTYCADDVIKYNIYFSAIQGNPYVLLASSNNATTTTLAFNNLISIAGCYAVTAVDSFANESKYSNIYCIDNCPVYELPNVFTPNGDHFNDLFVPFPYKYVKDIDLKIFNRWGDIVFETTDPKINWDGKHKESKQQCTDGVYFYTCIVNEIRLVGIVPRQLKGFVQLFNNPDSSPAE